MGNLTNEKAEIIMFNWKNEKIQVKWNFLKSSMVERQCPVLLVLSTTLYSSMLKATKRMLNYSDPSNSSLGIPLILSLESSLFLIYIPIFLHLT